MKFTTFETAQENYKKTVGLSKFVIIIIVTTSLFSNLFLGYLLAKASSTAIVLDSKGVIYNTKSAGLEDTRIYEYEDHIRSFYSNWYAFDETSYDQHIEAGLNMIGDVGKELYNEYNDLQIKTNMIQKNLRYEVKISKVQIDMNTTPISGHIEGIQTCLRAKGQKSRTICANFTIYDVSRSKTNIHGCKIEQWKIYESKELVENADSIATPTQASTITQ